MMIQWIEWLPKNICQWCLITSQFVVSDSENKKGNSEKNKNWGMETQLIRKKKTGWCGGIVIIFCLHHTLFFVRNLQRKGFHPEEFRFRNQGYASSSIWAKEILHPVEFDEALFHCSTGKKQSLIFSISTGSPYIFLFKRQPVNPFLVRISRFFRFTAWRFLSWYSPMSWQIWTLWSESSWIWCESWRKPIFW